MGVDSEELVKRLAPGNAVDLEKLAFVHQQLRQLERAGIVKRGSYAIERPLGRITQSGDSHTLANVAGLAQR